MSYNHEINVMLSMEIIIAIVKENIFLLTSFKYIFKAPS